MKKNTALVVGQNDNTKSLTNAGANSGTTISQSNADVVMWDMDISLSITGVSDELPVIVTGRIYMDEDFAYYDRIATIFSDNYHKTVRFDKSELEKVLVHIIRESPHDIIPFISTLSGYSVVDKKFVRGHN